MDANVMSVKKIEIYLIHDLRVLLHEVHRLGDVTNSSLDRTVLVLLRLHRFRYGSPQHRHLTVTVNTKLLEAEGQGADQGDRNVFIPLLISVFATVDLGYK